ncbi:16576_t:CDS:2, partial [Entrophospora sp. SA101]
HQNGAVFILTIGQNQSCSILHRFNGHDQEIQGLSWSIPTGIDKTICIWNVESETRVKELTLPAPMSHLTDSQKKRLCKSFLMLSNST